MFTDSRLITYAYNLNNVVQNKQLKPIHLINAIQYTFNPMVIKPNELVL